MNSPDLIPIGVGIAAFLIAVVMIITEDEKPVWWQKTIMWLLFISGILMSLAFIVYPPWRHAGADIAGLHWGGVPFILTIFVWSAFMSFFEAFQRGAMNPDADHPGHGHHIRTPLGCFIAGATMLLWSFAGLSPVGIGVILLGIAGILGLKKRWRHVASVAAIAGGMCIGATLLLEWTSLADQKFFGLAYSWYIALVTGLVVVFMLFRDNRFRHLGTPVWAAAFGIAVVISGGHLFSHTIQHLTQTGPTTVSRINNGHQDRNPLDKLIRKADHQIGKHLGDHPARHGQPAGHHAKKHHHH